MRILMKNIGMVSEADVVVDTITVIAGENNTGKSTIGKSIYAFLEGLRLVEQNAETNKIISIRRQLAPLDSLVVHARFGRNKNNDNKKQSALLEVAEHIDKLEMSIYRELEYTGDLIDSVSGKNIKKMISEAQEIERILNDKKGVLGDDLYSRAIQLVENLLEMLQIDAKHISIKQRSLQRIFDSEFGRKISSIFAGSEDSFVKIFSDGISSEISFVENKVSEKGLKIEHKNESGVIYIDNPFILDDINFDRFRRKSERYSHKDVLLSRLNVNEEQINLFEETYNRVKFQELFDGILDEDLVFSEGNLVYGDSSKNYAFDAENLATGLKSFAIIKMLLASGELADTEMLILDEPEIHLHPEWQLRYAELIVLLQVNYGLKVLITSHSPYFVEAIELFSKKHNISKSVRFYQTAVEKRSAKILDVTEQLVLIYNSLAKPYITLEELRDDVNGDD